MNTSSSPSPRHAPSTAAPENISPTEATPTATTCPTQTLVRAQVGPGSAHRHRFTATRMFSRLHQSDLVQVAWEQQNTQNTRLSHEADRNMRHLNVSVCTRILHDQQLGGGDFGHPAS